MSENYYGILGVSENSSLEEIRKQYQNLVLQYHPDKLCGDQTSDPAIKEKFLKITEAWETLRDPEKRKVYDSVLLQTSLDDNNLKFDSVSYHSLQFVDSCHCANCKCGGTYDIQKDDLDFSSSSCLYIPCSSCSLFMEVVKKNS